MRLVLLAPHALLGTLLVTAVTTFCLLLTGCRNGAPKENQVVSEEFIHKFGYTVSREEWTTQKYPGQVVTHLKCGSVVTTSYENGVLHGPTTITFPRSQTVHHYTLYNQGNRVKEIEYDANGMPLVEFVQLSPARHMTTSWYEEGTPLSIEEFANEELVEGQYFTPANELETRVEKGKGTRIRRDRRGALLSRERIDEGYVTQRETFFSNGMPESITLLFRNKEHGEKRLFTEQGEPLAIEEWIHGERHGLSSYFKNGSRALDVSYLNGKRNGIEREYREDGHILKEIHWEEDMMHGPCTFYIEGLAKTQWYYCGKPVSKSSFDEQAKLDQMVLTEISPEVQCFSSPES